MTYEFTVPYWLGWLWWALWPVLPALVFFVAVGIWNPPDGFEADACRGIFFWLMIFAFGVYIGRAVS